MDNQNNNGSNDNTTTSNNKSRRGFASWDLDKQRRVASLGGIRAHETGKAHQYTSEEAREAGKKGGGKVSLDREHMAEIGRKGGLSRAKKNAHAVPPPSPFNVSDDVDNKDVKVA